MCELCFFFLFLAQKLRVENFQNFFYFNASIFIFKLDLRLISTWTESDVNQWMKEMGYPEYATIFLENNIDGKILLDLNKEDFTSLGITSVGHRKALERQIQQLRDKVNDTYSETMSPTTLSNETYRQTNSKSITNQ
ncbi:hypothetical protein RFI_20426, partial [Reticulomyxa filosa]